MKKILFVNASLTNGGSERVMVKLANYMSSFNGFNVAMISIIDDNITYKLNNNIKLYNLHEKKNCYNSKFSRIRKIRNVVKKYKPDCVISFMYNINIYTLISCIGICNNVIVSERNNPHYRSKITKLLEELFYSIFARKVVFQTEEVKNYYSKSIRNKSVVIPNPVDQVNSIYYNSESKKIIAIGRLNKQKNFSLLIHAFSMFLSKYPDYNLFIYGDGDLRDDLISLCEKLKITNSVFFPGFVSDISDKFKDAHMYVSSSDFEGISNSMLEALSYGIPTISTDSAGGGAKSMIIDGVNGILVPVNDENRLYEAMCIIAGDNEFANNISNNSYKLIKNYSIDKIFSKWNDLIEGDINEK